MDAVDTFTELFVRMGRQDHMLNDWQPLRDDMRSYVESIGFEVRQTNGAWEFRWPE